MAQNELPDFMVIDDDPVNNKICSIIIQKLYPGKQVTSFTDPEAALAFIPEKYGAADANKVILLLDINMPILNGWDVLDRLEVMPTAITDLFRIFILSSSVDLYDKQKAQSNKLVSGYIEKPLSMAAVKSFFESE